MRTRQSGVEGGGILQMSEDDTSGCNSQAVSCIPIASAVTAAFVRVPTVCHCEETPMESLQKGDGDRNQQWHAGQSYVPSAVGCNDDDADEGLCHVESMPCTIRRACGGNFYIRRYLPVLLMAEPAF